MNDLETHVLELIGESTTAPDVFADTPSGMEPIRDSLNDAIEEISMLTGSSKRTYYVPLEDGQGFYRLRLNRDRFAWVTDAWISASKWRLEQTDIIKLQNFNPRWMDNTGVPRSYFQVGKNVVGFYPRPASSSDLIELSCVIIPDRYIEDTDRIRLRDNYKWAAAHYAVGEYYASRGDAKQALYHHGLYLDKVGIQVVYPFAAERRWQYQSRKAPWPTPTG